MDIYSYFTDGAASMNFKNGQYLREAGGWAFLLFINGEESLSQSGGCPLTTNNEMELYAIYASIKDFLIKSKEKDIIEIYSDSSYCIDIFTQWAKNWQKNGWKKSNGKAIKNLNIIKIIWSLIEKINEKSCTLKFIKVEGHSSNVLNNRVDELAVNAKMNAFKTGQTIGYNGIDDFLLGNKSNTANTIHP